MSNDDYEQETINYSNSKQQNTFVENDFLVHLTKPNFSVENIINDNQIQSDDEENFTDLRSCVVTINTDSGKNISYSSYFFMNK
jgi:hypothetical protein